MPLEESRRLAVGASGATAYYAVACAGLGLLLVAAGAALWSRGAWPRRAVQVLVGSSGTGSSGDTQGHTLPGTATLHAPRPGAVDSEPETLPSVGVAPLVAPLPVGTLARSHMRRQATGRPALAVGTSQAVIAVLSLSIFCLSFPTSDAQASESF